MVLTNTTPAARLVKRRILLVDDHPILRESFGQLINLEEELEVCGQAEDAAGAMGQLAAELPDLLIVDIELRGCNGIELIKCVKAKYPTLPILALSVHDELLYAERALRAGASGYVMKQAAIGEVMAALRQVLRGERYLSPRMQARLLDQLNQGPLASSRSDLECLTDRELEIFQLIGAGHRTREIAGRLGLSVKTVETHRAHIIEKLQLRDTVELIRYAVQRLPARPLKFEW